MGSALSSAMWHAHNFLVTLERFMCQPREMACGCQPMVTLPWDLEQHCQDLTNNMSLDLGGMSLCHALRAKESPKTPLTHPSLLHPQCLIPCVVSSDKLIHHWTSSPSMPRLG
ncbi:hypothetical protein RHMOL_Rhmol05G0121000 [Rhododendron molle]|uniref:Uncharacterized protein n=1 Tax=Rhododendron molle TaxID=49168 RepID=A0ACC0NPP6_RHOML|nr:hypothetical protein RHMOL_Rhmol05G0121000 [Rhododendron molle]